MTMSNGFNGKQSPGGLFIPSMTFPVTFTFVGGARVTLEVEDIELIKNEDGSLKDVRIVSKSELMYFKPEAIVLIEKVAK